VKIQIHANMIDQAEETYKRISELEDSIERERSLAKSRLMIQIFKQNWSQAEIGKLLLNRLHPHFINQKRTRWSLVKTTGSRATTLA